MRVLFRVICAAALVPSKRDVDVHIADGMREPGVRDVSMVETEQRTGLSLWTSPAHGREVCHLGNVKVIQDAADRYLIFDSDGLSAVEAKVECAGGEGCEGCSPCACEAVLAAPESLGTSYHQLISELLAPTCKEPASRVLLVGLGGAVLMQYLAEHCGGMSLDAFELSADVVRAATDFFGLQEARARHPGRIAVSTVDAAEGLAALQKGGEGLELASGTSPYDAVVIDCFSGKGKIPDACRSRESLEAVRDVLKPGGMLLQNVWAKSPALAEVAGDYEALKTDYEAVFAEFKDHHVPMPPGIDFVRILAGTK